MTQRVALFRDPGDGAHVTSLPAWIAPQGHGRYWHQPRSATIYDGRLSVRYWCGQQATVRTNRLTDEPPDELRCGTCLGRRAGYDRTGGAVFRPRDHWALPSRCPGNGWDPPDFKVCNACGERVQAARGWNAWGSSNHRAGAGIASRLRPCPRHGWKDIGEADGGFRCRAWRCGWNADMPRSNRPR